MTSPEIIGIDLEKAERYRHEKAERTQNLRPSTPDAVGEYAAEAFSRLTKLRKASPLDTMNPEQTERVEGLRRVWNAPARHVCQTTHRGERWMMKLSELRPKLGTGMLLAFYGARGPGKTQMAVELMRYQTGQRLKSAIYAKAMDVFISLRATYGQFATRDEAKAIAEWTKPALLVIDETQVRGETPWEDKVLTHIIDKRYDDLKDTILISNFEKEQMLESVGASIATRIKETGGTIHFDWESFR